MTKLGETIGLVTGGLFVDAQGQTQVLATIEQKNQPSNFWRVISGGAKCPGSAWMYAQPALLSHRHARWQQDGAAGRQDGKFAPLGTIELYDTFTGVPIAGPGIIPRS